MRPLNYFRKFRRYSPQILLFNFLLLFTCVAQALDFRVLAIQEQAQQPFLQGLTLDRGILYMSSGRYGKSWLATVDAASNAELNRVRLDPEVFAEGLCIVDDKLYLLSWHRGRLFIFDKHSLRQIDQRRYEGEGWGLTHDGKEFVMSDGSSSLQFRDSLSFALIKRVEVRDQGQPVDQLNELEWAQNAVWANAWHTPFIYKIDPDSGKVLAKYNMQALVRVQQKNRPEAVLNGIAYDGDGSFWISGKLWDHRYRVKFNR